jgi:hypothetical protein
MVDLRVLEEVYCLEVFHHLIKIHFIMMRL